MKCEKGWCFKKEFYSPVRMRVERIFSFSFHIFLKYFLFSFFSPSSRYFSWPSPLCVCVCVRVCVRVCVCVCMLCWHFLRSLCREDKFPRKPFVSFNTIINWVPIWSYPLFHYISVHNFNMFIYSKLLFIDPVTAREHIYKRTHARPNF